jgi:hypothetical protein
MEQSGGGRVSYQLAVAAGGGALTHVAEVAFNRPDGDANMPGDPPA